MPTSTFLTQTTWTGLNALQPSSQTPVDVTAYSDTRPTQYIQTTIDLPAATVTPISLPIPSSWSNVYAVQLTNTNASSNNCYVQVVVGAGTSATLTASLAVLYFTSNVTAAQTLVLNGHTFTAVSGTPSAFQFQVGGTLTTSISNAVTAINLQTSTTGIEVAYDLIQAVPTLLLRGGNLTSISGGTWTPLASGISTFPVTGTLPGNTLMLAPVGGTFSSTSFLGASQTGTPLDLSTLTVQAVDNTGNYATSNATQLYVYLAGA